MQPHGAWKSALAIAALIFHSAIERASEPLEMNGSILQAQCCTNQLHSSYILAISTHSSFSPFTICNLAPLHPT